MDGKTHLKLGITTSLAVTIVAAKGFDSNILLQGLLLAPTASVITSQLADIDSKNSKISKIIPIVNWIKSEIFLLIALLLGLASYFFTKMLPLGFDYFFGILFNISVSMFMLYAFAKIFLKHRKLTHCILSCLGISIISFYPYYRFNYSFLFFIGLGLSVGYISHIFYDCLTVKGCPLFYPIIKKTIKGPLVSSKHGNIAMFISMIFIVLSLLYYFELFPIIIDFLQEKIKATMN